MSENIEEGAPYLIPNDGEDRISAGGINDAGEEGVVFGGVAMTTVQNSMQRSGDGGDATGPSDLEWEFLTRWGLFKSPLRWNIPQQKPRK